MYYLVSFIYGNNHYAGQGIDLSNLLHFFLIWLWSLIVPFQIICVTFLKLFRTHQCHLGLLLDRHHDTGLHIPYEGSHYTFGLFCQGDIDPPAHSTQRRQMSPWVYQNLPIQFWPMVCPYGTLQMNWRYSVQLFAVLRLPLLFSCTQSSQWQCTVNGCTEFEVQPNKAICHTFYHRNCNIW